MALLERDGWRFCYRNDWRLSEQNQWRILTVIRRNKIIDIRILADARKHGAPLAAIDGEIPYRAAQLAAISLRVKDPVHAAKEISDAIRKRDEIDLQMHAEFGVHLPDWHGKD